VSGSGSVFYIVLCFIIQHVSHKSCHSALLHLTLFHYLTSLQNHNMITLPSVSMSMSMNMNMKITLQIFSLYLFTVVLLSDSDFDFDDDVFLCKVH
jgi:hypothetical protein